MDFPQIDRSSIWAMVEFVEAAKKQPELLTSGDCPYPKEWMEVVRGYFNKDRAKEATTNSFEDLENEIQALYTELDEFKSAIDQDQDGQIYVSYMRLRSTLLVKMVEVKERIYNAKSLKLFQDRVLTGIDRVCSPEQRTQFMEYLEGKK